MKLTLCSIFLTILIVQARRDTLPPTDLGPGYDPLITTLTDGSFIVFSFLANQISIYNANGQLSGSADAPATNFQSARAAALSGDSFVLCWIENNGFINLLYTLRFSVDGTGLSNPLRINYDNVLDYQLTGLNDGGYVIVWTVQYSTNIALSYGLVFNSDDSPRGKQFLIYQGSLDSWQSSPVVASLVSGDFFVTWNHPDSGSIYGQLYSPDGTPKTVPVAINTKVSVVSVSAATGLAAGQTSGQILVAWQGWDNQDPKTFRIWAQILNSDGALVGDNFLVQTNEPSQYHSLRPAVGALSSGGFVISWYLNISITACSSELYFQLYDVNGLPIEEPSVVNGPDIAGHINGHPDIAAMQDGGFVIAFQNLNSHPEMFAQRYNANGMSIPFEKATKKTLKALEGKNGFLL